MNLQVGHPYSLQIAPGLRQFFERDWFPYCQRPVPALLRPDALLTLRKKVETSTTIVNEDTTRKQVSTSTTVVNEETTQKQVSTSTTLAIDIELRDDEPLTFSGEVDHPSRCYFSAYDNETDECKIQLCARDAFPDPSMVDKDVVGCLHVFRDDAFIGMYLIRT